MNPKIRQAIIEAFNESPTRSKDSLPNEIERKIGVSAGDVVRTIGLMLDAGELAPTGISGYRLTLKAIESTAPLHQRFLTYAYQNWIAISALALSLIALLK